MESTTTPTTPASPESIRRAMFNQGCPLSAGTIHDAIWQGTHGTWPPVATTQITLDAMEAEFRVQRGGCERWGWSYWLVPLEGFDR